MNILGRSTNYLLYLAVESHLVFWHVDRLHVFSLIFMSTFVMGLIIFNVVWPINLK